MQTVQVALGLDPDIKALFEAGERSLAVQLQICRLLRSLAPKSEETAPAAAAANAPSAAAPNAAASSAAAPNSPPAAPTPAAGVVIVEPAAAKPGG